MKRMDRQTTNLATFYRMTALRIRINGKITLHELETINRKNADKVYSWMQWADAKRFFQAGTGEDGIEYRLRRELQGMTHSELYNEINGYYKKDEAR